jgi:hypothetical protein
MAKLPPLDKDGTVTAGNAPGVNDGAAALVLASEDYARRNGREVLAHVVDHAAASWDPAYLALTPAMAIQKLLDARPARERHHVWEVNEAFAAVALEHGQRGSASIRDDQQIGRRGRLRSSDRRLGRAHHRERRAPVAPSRRRARHRGDLQRRRTGRRGPDSRRLTASTWRQTYAFSSSARVRWARASRRWRPKPETRYCSTIVRRGVRRPWFARDHQEPRPRGRQGQTDPG